MGAIVGYLAGALAGVIGKFVYLFDFNLTTFLSAGVALITVPLISYFTKKENEEKLMQVWDARNGSAEEEAKGDVYNIFPKTKRGKMSFLVYISGVVIFVTGVISGSSGWPTASIIAVVGMLIYFLGGYLRVHHN